ncbi:hypothetical protein KJ652_07095 [Patescibacteria group bacterium]|nr:hypothetical protein [Patescibacteria group bacterium]MBU1124315.1 hypothetical protein [Patescibacteria group bacterium]MBU1910802.1 hypothetical protein [Patescibacteria group bacterium]
MQNFFEPPIDAYNGTEDGDGDDEEGGNGRDLIRRAFPGYKRPSPDEVRGLCNSIQSLELSDINSGTDAGKIFWNFYQLTVNNPTSQSFRSNVVARKFKWNPHNVRAIGRLLASQCYGLLNENPPLSGKFTVAGACMENVMQVLPRFTVDPVIPGEWIGGEWYEFPEGTEVYAIHKWHKMIAPFRARIIDTHYDDASIAFENPIKFKTISEQTAGWIRLVMNAKWTKYGDRMPAINKQVA